MILPLLVTINKLLSHGLLDELIMAQDSLFARKLMACIASEAKRCTDVKRLLAIVDVSINLLHPRTHAKIVSTSQVALLVSLRVILSDEKIQEQILPFLLIELLNRYPVVRRHTAEELYVKMIEDPTIFLCDENAIDKGSQILLTTVWHDDQDSALSLTDSRNKLVDLFSITLPIEERKRIIGRRKGPKSKPRDDFECYSSLVN